MAGVRLKYVYRASKLDGVGVTIECIEEEILSTDLQQAMRKSWGRAVLHLRPQYGVESLRMEFVRLA